MPQQEFHYRGVVGKALVVVTVVAGLGGIAFADEERIRFNRDVRPILSDNCFVCHGFDPATREAGMRLDTFEGATEPLRSGGAGIVPGSPEQSKLIQRITAGDPQVVMPPPESGKSLTAEQIQILSTWIEQGARYEQHWSFIPPVQSDPPSVHDADWPRNAIDHFVLARLEREGLTPSPEADKPTLIRRVTYDLTGLPPTPQEVADFLADEREDAYGRLVDRLLASPRYGEHMARYWLDAARYGDTHALHFDNKRSIWRWRDWVIEAYNDNMPFDQFTIEQLAGDLLPEPTLSQRIATGFNRNNPTTNEGGVIEEEYRVKYAVDRVDTTATVWLGLTMACAQCHDHKYDPITQKEFFEFYAFFNSLNEPIMDSNFHAPPPAIRAPTPAQEREQAILDAKIAELHAALHVEDPQLDDQQRQWEIVLTQAWEEHWRVMEPTSFTSSGGATLTMLEDHSILAGGDNADQDVYEIVAATDMDRVTAIRLEALTHETLPHGGAGRAANGNFVLSEIELQIASTSDPDQVRGVTFIGAEADYEQSRYLAAELIDGSVKEGNGWAVDGMKRRENRFAVLIPTEPIVLQSDEVLRFRLRHESQHAQHHIGRVRLSVTNDPHYERAVCGDWYALGPFHSTGHRGAYDRSFGPEFGVDLAQTVGGKTWEKRSDLIDGKPYRFKRSSRSAVYLYRTIRVPAPRRMTLNLGSDDSIRVWLNGRLVHDHFVERKIDSDRDKVMLHLRPGENELLIKVANGLNEFAFYHDVTAETAGAAPLPIHAIAATQSDQRADEDVAALREHFRHYHSEYGRTLGGQLQHVRMEYQRFIETLPMTLVMKELPEPRDTFVLIRGEYDQPGEQVYPGVPAALPPLDEHEPRNRLTLARWLVDGANPLTARVTVNRYWARYFGAGIVRTVEDLGSQGQWPSHPELLDWLATEFVRTGWDVKAMQRLLVTSATYRQTSRLTPQLQARDPQNRLLARASRHRFDGEVIRDTALAVSGLLHEQLGGPGYKAPQPPGIWEAVSYPTSDTANFVADEGSVLYRRSMYMFWKRTAPPPNLVALDAPNREACTVRRERTNTPLQALVLMNDPQFVEAARALGQRVLTEMQDSLDERLIWAFRLCTARSPSEAELQSLRAFYESQIAVFREHPDRAEALTQVGEMPLDESLDVVEVATWTMVANVLLNLDETMSRQ